ESVYSILSELNLPATLENLRNPTEAFMIHIISEFLQRFQIDVAAIKRTTLEQNSALRVTNPENAIIVSLINLREVMCIIGNEIFLKDFSINDFTSPGTKRTRTHLKFIANFALYARNARTNMQQRINEVLTRGQYIDDVRKKKQSIIEVINKNASEVANNKVNNENLKSNIEVIQKNIEIRKCEANKLDGNYKISDEKRLNTIERYQAKCAELKKLKEISEHLKNKVVKEPESFKLRLQELEEECNSKKEKRTSVQEAIQSKKPMIQNLENALAFVRKQRTKLPEVIDLQIKLIECNQMNESLKRQIEEATHLIDLEANRDREDEEKVTVKEVKKCEMQCEEKLNKLRSIHNELLAEKKALERKLMNYEAQEVELCIERDNIRGKIVELEAKINQFLRQCQELCNNKIKDMEMAHENAEDQMQLMN
ncbi:hypothetical protein PV326_004198, partial [Microctonus aethiopoides]